MSGLVLRLYIAGRTPAAERALRNLDHLVGELDGECRVAVTDILEQPDLAEQERILATPVLVKEAPAPVRRIVGDLSEREKVLASLGLEPQ
ncbi:circadian clock KaiB family protein [Halorhodospira neutriphila]|uniref:Circadian clock protein KaiB n=1 Tax=Halorhodospira neutriphila TaxID=168379 RepID=A0ABS1E815_9GAMM|nr:circadian clock KaiB family protein [Halorhodospira neutriphila]MBK1727108.1 circadian clock protein KaiB [Halorhodospira neutriphila]